MLEELLERSAETDIPTLLKAKEEAKRRMRNDPSPQNVSVFEKASRMMEARMGKTDHVQTENLASITAVLEYLLDCGRKVRKSKLYQDVKTGLLARQPGGGFSKAAVDAYAQALPLVAVPKVDSDNIKELARRRQEATIQKIEEETARIRFKREAERGRFIPREQVELELAGRAVVLETGLRQAVEMNVLDLIHLVDGDPRKSQRFLEVFEGYLNEALNQFASKAEFEVTFTDADSGNETETE
ncbi:MAG: hypothetical protein KKE73_05390 [Proteobacteria bacterium]|nr:hypothetical protein [Pseudomonadota bacterium]